jgi:hypothetical protein
MKQAKAGPEDNAQRHKQHNVGNASDAENAVRQKRQDQQPTDESENHSCGHELPFLTKNLVILSEGEFATAKS